MICWYNSVFTNAINDYRHIEWLQAHWMITNTIEWLLVLLDDYWYNWIITHTIEWLIIQLNNNCCNRFNQCVQEV